MTPSAVSRIVTLFRFHLTLLSLRATILPFIYYFFARNNSTIHLLLLRDKRILAGGPSSNDTSVHRYHSQHPATDAMATRAANKRVRLPLLPITHDHYADIPYSS